MKTSIYIPVSLRCAKAELRVSLARPLEKMTKDAFVRVWCSVAYLFPGLHPDGYEETDSGWPRVLRRVAAEAWRRSEAGELADEELYPSDAQWAGLCDRMNAPRHYEIERRAILAARFGAPANG